MSRKPRTTKHAAVETVEQFSQDVATIQPMTAAEIVQQVADSTHLPPERDVFDEAVAAQKSVPVAADTNVGVKPAERERQPGEDEPEDRWAKAVSKMGKRVGGGRHESAGLRVDIEAEPMLGLPFARVLVTFAERPAPNETGLLRDNGFKWNGESWQARKSAATQELAYRLVNQIIRGRDGEGRGFYI